MIRILHIVSSTFTGSGVMQFLMNYYRNIDHSKYQFDFVAFKHSDDNYDTEIQKIGGKVFYIDKPSLNFKYKKELKQIFNDNNYDIVHCHPIFSFLLIGNLRKKYKIKNLIQHSHTNKFSGKKLSYIRNKLILKLAPFYVTKYCACSSEALELFSKRDLNKKGYIIINNSIDYSKYKYNVDIRNKIRKKLNIDEKVTVIGHVGRFSVEKNHEIIIKCYKKILEKKYNCILLLIGDGPLKSKMNDIAKENKIDDNIIFTGNISNVNEYLSAMDIFLFPSSFEGFGLALLEAQLNGLKCITSYNVPNNVIVTENVNRCNIDIDDIVEEIEKSIKAKENNRCVNILNNDYDIKNNVSEIEKFYTQLNQH